MTAELTWRAWNLVGLSVTRLQLDERIALDIESADCALTLVVKNECYLQVANRAWHRLLAGQPETLPPLLPVLNQPLLRFMVASTGNCKLLLANSTVIWTEIPAAWESYGQGSLVSASFHTPAIRTPTRLQQRLTAPRQR